jgi:moderate conductance mechanosensitive channel
MIIESFIQKSLFGTYAQKTNGRQCKQLFSVISFIGLLSLFILSLQASTVYGQIPGLSLSTGSQAPQGVERFGFNEIIYVDFNGKKLFRIASPLVLNRSDPGSQIPVELRAAQIKSNLDQLVATTASDVPKSYSTLIDPKTLQIKVEEINGQPVLLVKDAHLVEPRVILTVTDSDAQYYSTPKEELAKRWQTLLKASLREALESRQPEAFKQQTEMAALYFGGTVLSTLAVAGFWWLLGKRKQDLEELQKKQETSLPHIESESGLHLLAYLQRVFGLKGRLQLVRFLRWFLFWAFFFLWTAGLAATLYQFPQTQQFAISLISTPILILVAALVAGLADSLSTVAIDQFLKASASSEIISLETLQRKSQRILTIAGVLQGLKTALIYIVAVIFVLQTLQIAPVSILTLGAVLALAASFAAQSLVKDLTNGLLIVLEDQYSVGDYISINTVSGLVENLNLRITQLRSNSGNLITIPNSQIQQVENMGKGWSRATVLIDVAYETDIIAAFKTIHETLNTFAQEPEWKPLILQPEELLGLDNISHTGMTIKVWVRTMPLKQWSVGRELRRRIKLALDSNGVRIGALPIVSIQQPTNLPIEESKQNK